MDPGRIFDFSGKSVLMIGASLGGIGTAIASDFQDFGAQVVVTGVEDTPVESVRDRFIYVRLDVTDEAAVLALAAATPRLDVLVNCAGVSGRGQQADVDMFERVVDLNLTGTYRTCVAFLRQLTASSGCVENIGSMYGYLGSPKVVG